MKSWLEKKDIEMYLTHNEGEPVVAERFIKLLKKIKSTSLSKICILIYWYTTIHIIEQLKWNMLM